VQAVEPIKAEAAAKTIRLDERLQQRRVEQSGTETPPATLPLPLPGSMLGNYEILHQIGEGGMGIVYKARDTVLDRTVAIKILPPHLTQNPEFLRRIRTEAYAHARLHHPNIVTLYSVQELPAGFMLIMEYVEGRTLQQYISENGPFMPAEALWIFEQALQGIAYAHQMGIVHRDLKPDNIILTHQGEVKLMDFGIARIVDNKEPTRSRSMVGTLLYISPEQINGREADFRSDIYTLGISLFETVTGRLPFERKTDYALMHAHVLENPTRPRHVKRDLPRELEKVILKSIEKDPDRRYQTAVEFREALLQQGLRQGLQPPAGRARQPESPTLGARLVEHNRILGGLRFDLLLVALILVLALALGLHPGKERPVDNLEPITRLNSPNTAPVTVIVPPGGQSTNSPIGSSTPPSKDRYQSLRKAWGG